MAQRFAQSCAEMCWIFGTSVPPPNTDSRVQGACRDFAQASGGPARPQAVRSRAGPRRDGSIHESSSDSATSAENRRTHFRNATCQAEPALAARRRGARCNRARAAHSDWPRCLESGWLSRLTSPCVVAEVEQRCCSNVSRELDSRRVERILEGAQADWGERGPCAGARSLLPESSNPLMYRTHCQAGC